MSDWRKIEIGPFVLDADRLYSKIQAPRDKKRREKFLAVAQEALDFLHGMDERNPFYLGDLWNFLKQHYPEECAQLLDHVALTEGTLDNYGWVAQSIPPSKRRFDQGVEFTKHQSVAALAPKDRDEILRKAKDERLTLSGVRQEVRKLKRRKISEGAGELVGKYRVIYADPPWAFDDQGRMPSGARSTTADHYENMSIEDICAMAIEAHARADAVLFLWVPVPILPEAFRVIDAWGFSYKQKIVWDKVRHNLGHYVSSRHEDLLIATRGSCTPDRLVPMIDNVQTFKAEGEHSEKPGEFRKIIERLYDGPYLELFARHEASKFKRKGWTFWGDQVGVLAA